MLLPPELLDKIFSYLPFKKAIQLSEYSCYKQRSPHIVYHIAARQGNLKMLNWLHRHVGPKSLLKHTTTRFIENVLYVVASCGNLKVLKWFEEKEYPIDQQLT